MAKKAAAKKKTDSPNSTWKVGDKVPSGYKQHEDHITPARSTTCKVCGKAITPKNPKAPKASKEGKRAVKLAAALAGSNPAVELIKQAQQFVKAAGGTANAAEILLALGGGGIVDNG